MSATQSESNPGFSGMAPSAGACLSTQEVWQRIGDMAGQVSSLATLHDTLSATLLSTKGRAFGAGWLPPAWVGKVQCRLTTGWSCQTAMFR